MTSHVIAGGSATRSRIELDRQPLWIKLMVFALASLIALAWAAHLRAQNVTAPHASRTAPLTRTEGSDAPHRSPAPPDAPTLPTATEAVVAATTLTSMLWFERTGSLARVGFDHAGHASRTTCIACHADETVGFPQQRREGVYLMSDMNAGRTCGACHDGQRAFSTMACGSCHEPR